MGLSQRVIDVITKYSTIICEELPLLDILEDLKCQCGLSDLEIYLITAGPTREERNDTFIQVLQSHNDTDFYHFCLLLQDHPYQWINELGINLACEGCSDDQISTESQEVRASSEIDDSALGAVASGRSSTTSCLRDASLESSKSSRIKFSDFFEELQGIDSYDDADLYGPSQSQEQVDPSLVIVDTSNGLNSIRNLILLSENHKMILEDNYEKIVDHCASISLQICIELRTVNTFKEFEMETIENMPNDSLRMSTLLDILIAGTKDSFDKFCKCLQCMKPEVAELLRANNIEDDVLQVQRRPKDSAETMKKSQLHSIGNQESSERQSENKSYGERTSYSRNRNDEIDPCIIL
ncbi:hypothetical protein TrispH2_008225 [Trichoplax sp. H2]|nr:hypothetical protein TrispH2_008225 [Trichoplax sp. H2]|eukprot:RDD39616.1 hypothetical protein TrispH2_008225 [Trichoplax sp. H2]